MVERTIRRRNVTSRDRTGCVTCRARRLKCDEAKPDCNNCIRLNVQCGGYVRRLVFKDQTERFAAKHGQKDLSDKRRPVDGNNDTDRSAPGFGGVVRDLPSAGFDRLGPQSDHGQSSQRQITPEADALTMNIPDCNHTSPPSEDFAALSPAPNDPQGLGPAAEPVRPDTGDQGYAAGGPIESRQHALLYDEGECETSPGYERFRPRPDYQIPVPAPIAPSGLLESAKFAEDMLYYHHLRDSSPYGLLSTLFLNDIFQAEHLDGAFFHAALALSALSISVSNAPEPLVAKASLHALDHFVTALGSIRSAHLDDSDNQSAQAETFVLPQGRYMAISWLATIVFLAYFELQRGQLKLWYIHCRAALAFLSQNLSSVRASAAGESLTRSFARIASLLEIYDRTYSDISRIASTDVSESLMLSLANSPYHADRLLCILPRVIELEEKWRGNPQHDTLWRQQAEHLVDELEAWRESLPHAEAPLAQDEDKSKSFGIAEGPGFSVTPLTLVHARDPVKAATSFMHYLVSLLRLQTFYSPSSDRKSPPTRQQRSTSSAA
ncbi:hypothetical protein Ct61P_15540 [Colletotrichum tofieldiae]|nr:hypothetical protein Ct61P_15540 [Colletotrichum tofieldiae]